MLHRLHAQINQQNTKLKRYTNHFHNLYSLYTYLLLTLASGYRPVDETLGYRHSYQLSLGIVHIIDKEKSQINEGRHVYLCDIAKQQLLYYLDYCKYRNQYFKITQPRLAKRYQETVVSKAPLLFFIAADGEFLSANQSYVVQYFELFGLTVTRYDSEAEAFNVRLPLNWHRHYVRTLLLQASLLSESKIQSREKFIGARRVGEDSIAIRRDDATLYQKFSHVTVTEEKANAWMGHDSRENDIPFAKFSHLSVMDLKTVAEVLNKHLQQLDITAIEAR